MKSNYEPIRELASPVKDWYQWIDYESVWDAYISIPESETSEIILGKFKALQKENDELKLRIRLARYSLIGR